MNIISFPIGQIRQKSASLEVPANYSTHFQKKQDFYTIFQGKKRKMILCRTKLTKIQPHLLRWAGIFGSSTVKQFEKKGKTKMKRIVTTCTALILTCLMGLPTFAASTTPHNWYCKNNDSHTCPTLDSPMAFIDKYHAYYANKKAKDGDRVIYLTFDAGYTNGNVEKILDALKKHNAKGAFFILDNLIVRNPELVQRMESEGHLVCNHTKNHPDMTKITDKAAFEGQLTALADHYKELTGKEMAKVYRPPEGRFSEDNLRMADELGYKTVFWSFAYADWDNNRQMNPSEAMKKILAHTHNGEIMLLHPTSATNAAIMDDLLTALEKDGYRFGCLEELWK